MENIANIFTNHNKMNKVNCKELKKIVEKQGFIQL